MEAEEASTVIVRGGAAIKEGKETAAKNRPHDLRATMNAWKDRRRQHPLCLGLSQPVNPLAVVARLGACREAPGPSTASRFFDQDPEAAAQTSWLCQTQNAEVERIRLLRPAAPLSAVWGFGCRSPRAVGECLRGRLDSRRRSEWTGGCETARSHHFAPCTPTIVMTCASDSLANASCVVGTQRGVVESSRWRDGASFAGLSELWEEMGGAH